MEKQLQEIKEKVVGIIENYWGKDISSSQLHSKHVFSKEIGFSERELVYLYFFIKKEFSITKLNIDRANFTTINGISSSIQKALKS